MIIRRINEAAENIALKNPSLLSSRQKLLEKAREAVDSSGYVYKKGKSRSKRLCSTEELVGAKRVRTTASIRMDRIHALEEQIKDISDTIKYKEKRREQASALHNYKLCEDLTDEMGTLKAKRRECEGWRSMCK